MSGRWQESLSYFSSWQSVNKLLAHCTDNNLAEYLNCNQSILSPAAFDRGLIVRAAITPFLREAKYKLWSGGGSGRQTEPNPLTAEDHEEFFNTFIPLPSWSVNTRTNVESVNPMWCYKNMYHSNRVDPPLGDEYPQADEAFVILNSLSSHTSLSHISLPTFHQQQQQLSGTHENNCRHCLLSWHLYLQPAPPTSTHSIELY